MNNENNEMELQELIKKYNMKEGDEVLCTDDKGLTHGTGLFPLRKTWNYADLRIGEYNFRGDAGQLFKLPEGSPYLKQEPEFVRSVCENTAENQQALFDLGYSWSYPFSIEIRHLDKRFLYTNSDGTITFTNSVFLKYERQRYSFKTVATLLPEVIEEVTPPTESEAQREVRLVTEELEAVTQRLKELKEKLGE